MMMSTIGIDTHCPVQVLTTLIENHKTIPTLLLHFLHEVFGVSFIIVERRNRKYSSVHDVFYTQFSAYFESSMKVLPLTF